MWHRFQFSTQYLKCVCLCVCDLCICGLCLCCLCVCDLCLCGLSVCVVSVCVVSVCVVSVWREEAAGSGMRRHRKEEPHTKMWGNIPTPLQSASNEHHLLCTCQGTKPCQPSFCRAHASGVWPSKSVPFTAKPSPMKPQKAKICHRKFGWSFGGVSTS